MLSIASAVFIWLSVAQLGAMAVRPVAHPLPLLATAFSLLLAAVFEFFAAGQNAGVVHLTPLRVLILTMIFMVAWAVVNYSRQALSEEPNVKHYWRWVYAVLAAVVLVLVSNHVLLLWASWVAISLALHRLLLFYPERPRARLAAHKKFITARVAEIFLLTAFLLLGSHVGSFYLSDILVSLNTGVHSELAGGQSVPLEVQVAAVLIACVAILKCAQLPFHGWLIQVVEAPTPVSALLHAGVVNLGGFLLLITAPIVLAVPAAKWLVLVVAGLTAVLSALIMITRVSIKVRLAWSTSAQMGMMLVEIALGLYELAVVHLLAHSIYKAYAFLSAGSTVQQNLQRRLAKAARARWHDWLLSCVLSTLAVAGGAVLYNHLSLRLFDQPAGNLLSVLLLLTVAMMMLLAQRHSQATQGSLLYFLGLVVSLVGAYFSLKIFAHMVVPASYPAGATLFSAPDLWVCILVLALVGASFVLHAFPTQRLSEHLSMVLFAGLYLDEWATRFTLAIWPIYPPNYSACENQPAAKENAHE